MLHRDDDDTDHCNDDDVNDVITHADDARVCIGELALELDRPIDEGDRRLILCGGTIDNATTVAITMNGDNHFPQERRETQRRGAKEVHIVKTKEASCFNT